MSFGWHSESSFQRLMVYAPRHHTDIDILLLYLKWHV
jgi:hypothetical protein